MAVTVLSTQWIITCNGPSDDNLVMTMNIDRTNNAVAAIDDFTIVDFIRDQLALATSLPVKIEKREMVRTTED